MLLTLVGRLVSVMINICKKTKLGRMGGEEEGRGREMGSGEGEGRKGKGKEILMFRGQENILNGGRVEI